MAEQTFDFTFTNSKSLLTSAPNIYTAELKMSENVFKLTKQPDSVPRITEIIKTTTMWKNAQFDDESGNFYEEYAEPQSFSGYTKITIFTFLISFLFSTIIVCLIGENSFLVIYPTQWLYPQEFNWALLFTISGSISTAIAISASLLEYKKDTKITKHFVDFVHIGATNQSLIIEVSEEYTIEDVIGFKEDLTAEFGEAAFQKPENPVTKVKCNHCGAVNYIVGTQCKCENCGAIFT